MSMRGFPLKLANYYFPVTNVTANPEYGSVDQVQPKDALKGLECKTTVQQVNENRRNYRILLHLKYDGNEGRAPYRFNILAVGHYEVGETVPDEDVFKVAADNGASLLYSATREYLASITGRGPYEAVILPVVSFLGLHESLVKLDTSD